MLNISWHFNGNKGKGKIAESLLITQLSPTPKVLNKSVPRVPISKSASPSSSTP